jgi:hypothetical protein
MYDASLPQGERGYELLLHHCIALTHATDRRALAFRRLEDALGGELARLLVTALANRRRERFAFAL